jgi:rSAM/selenodomain-associated transferase 1
MRNRLIVFARLPRIGHVKSRLAAAVGAQRALDAHRALLEATIALAAGCAADTLELQHTDIDAPPTDDARCLLERLAAEGWRTGPQRGEDLGARMRGALESTLADGELPVLIGCDCPAMRVDDIAGAFDALARGADAVFSPAEDGGYALVGLSRSLPGLFEGIAWGSASVMGDTRARLAACGARAVSLRTVWDVDTVDDLARWESAAGTPHASPR